MLKFKISNHYLTLKLIGHNLIFVTKLHYRVQRFMSGTRQCNLDFPDYSFETQIPSGIASPHGAFFGIDSYSDDNF